VRTDAVDSDASGAYQLGSGRPTTVNQLLDAMRVATVQARSREKTVRN